LCTLGGRYFSIVFYVKCTHSQPKKNIDMTKDAKRTPQPPPSKEEVDKAVKTMEFCGLKVQVIGRLVDGKIELDPDGLEELSKGELLVPRRRMPSTTSRPMVARRIANRAISWMSIF
jgi:hypothetical protein